MNKSREYFSTTEVQSTIRRTHETLSTNIWATVDDATFQPFTLTALKLLSENSKQFDEICTSSIERFGERFTSELNGRLDKESFQNIVIYCYRFLSEFNFFKESGRPDSLS